jgi:hypothetical protein
VLERKGRENDVKRKRNVIMGKKELMGLRNTGNKREEMNDERSG